EKNGDIYFTDEGPNHEIRWPIGVQTNPTSWPRSMSQQEFETKKCSHHDCLNSAYKAFRVEKDNALCYLCKEHYDEIAARREQTEDLVKK
ncbi:hypothetical protein MUP77_17095, partial [Candidatus Bathyarchaeota archaeon]|nr:hypothetical protein [Candidatus Bathyarchaeota archaeon]